MSNTHHRRIHQPLIAVITAALLAVCAVAQAKDDKDEKGGKKSGDKAPATAPTPTPAALSPMGWPLMSKEQVDALVIEATTKTANRPALATCLHFPAAAQHGADGTVNFVCARPPGSPTRYAAYNLYLNSARQLDLRNGVCRFAMDYSICRSLGIYD